MSRLQDIHEQIFNEQASTFFTTLYEIIEKWNGELIIVEAPTGYGKSKSMFALANWTIEDRSLAERVIHVLPLKSIVEDLLLKSKVKKEELSLRVSIGAQAMSIIGSDKDPMFLRDFVITTFDSFTYNLFKLPISELSKDGAHFDIPRYAIYTAFVSFDEVQLLSGENRQHRNRSLSALCASIDALHSANVPILMMSATIPDTLMNKILRCGRINKKFIKISLSNKNQKLNNELKVRDKNFEERVTQLRPITKLIRENDIAKIALELFESGRSVLIVRNTISKVYETFNDLLEIKPFLIHARLCVRDRKDILKRISKLLKRKNVCLVGTQVIEAGVNLDFDDIITDAAPISSIVQRVGRVHREIDERINRGELEYEVYIVEYYKDQIYDNEIVTRTVKALKDHDLKINWKIPWDTELKGYKSIMNDVYSHIRFDLDGALRRVMVEIDQSLIISYKDVKRLIEKICSFVREDVLIPVVVPEIFEQELSHKNAYEAIINASVPLTKSYLERNKDILDYKNGKLALIVIDNSDVHKVWIEIDNINCSLEQKIAKKLKNKLGKVFNVIALTLKEGVYERGFGLIKGDS